MVLRYLPQGNPENAECKIGFTYGNALHWRYPRVTLEFVLLVHTLFITADADWNVGGIWAL